MHTTDGMRPDSTPPETRRSGLRIFLYVLAGLGGLLVLTCGAVAFMAWRSPVLRETIEAALQGQNAPGAQALRDAGCEEAVVMDVRKMLDALGEMAPEEAPPPEAPGLYVVCQHGEEGGPDCDETARVYLAALEEPPPRFVAQVISGVGRSAECQTVYDGAGNRIGTLEEAIDP